MAGFSSSRAADFWYEIKYFFSRSLKTKLIIFFLFLAFIPTLITGLFSFNLSSRIVYRMAVDSSSEMIDRISQELENLFSDTIYFMYHVQDIMPLQQGLRENFDSLEQRYLTDFNVSSELHFISDYKKEIFGIYVLGLNKSKFKSNYYTFNDDDLRDSSWYRTIFESNLLTVSGPYRESAAVKTTPNWNMEFFSLGIPFIDRQTGMRTGVILAEIEKRVIKKITDTTFGKTGYILILDNRNNILISSDKYDEQPDLSALPSLSPRSFQELIVTERFIGTDEDEETVFIDSDDYLVLYQILKIPGWKVVGVIPRNELRTDKDNILWVLLVLPLISCILAGFAAVKISSGIVKPVYQMSTLMKKAEGGNLQVRMTEIGNDEIGQLGRSFNIMVEKLDDLMTQIYSSQAKIRKTELQLLQAQINPHFLYNTLDAIKYLAKRGENDGVVRMVVSLAKFFRSSLSKGMAVITIEEELERIEHYLTILKIRYSNKFEYMINLPPELRSRKILKLLLQPIVENAVYHGIKEKPEPGHIIITVQQVDRNIVIMVKDSGCGMTEDRLDELRKSIHSRAFADRENYGLRNIQERIEIFFGPDYGLEFSSRYGEGTEVRIIIPAFSEELINDQSNNS